MKILWTVNLVPKSVSDELGATSDVLGGWIESMIGQLRNNKDIRLGVACKTDSNTHFQREINGVTYFSLSYKRKNQYGSLCTQSREIISSFKPDIVQIEGTEFIHAKAMLSEAKYAGIPNVVSMQGILNGQYDYQCGELPIDDMMFSRSLTKICTAWLLHLRKTRWYKPRMKYEKEIIESADNILGRTTWDRAHSYVINPTASYYSCARVLRPPFYSTNWDISKIERHSIYVGNGYRALKGLHFVLIALNQLVREFPDMKLYVAGDRPFVKNDKRPLYKRGYGAYIEKLIKDMKLSEYIEFTGPLSANEVAYRLSKTHVYVLSSTVENSPNTLGEAMMIGTPAVSAYVGGVPDMASDGKDTLYYRSNDSALLAWNIKRIFENDELAKSLSENGRIRAKETHDPEKNAEKLFAAYKEIISKG